MAWAVIASPLRAANLTAHYRLDEPGGTVAADSAGANPGSIGGSPTLGVTGVVQQAMTFKGGGDVVKLGTNVAVRPTGDFTATVWVKAGDTTSNLQILGAADGIGNANNGWILKPQGGGRLFFDVSTNGGLTKSADLIVEKSQLLSADPGVWTFMAVRFQRSNGANCVVFFTTVNLTAGGSAITSAAVTSNTKTTTATANATVFYPANATAIGARDTGTDGYLGTIDDVRFYDGVLTDQELADLYNAVTPGGSVTNRPLIVAYIETPRGGTEDQFGVKMRYQGQMIFDLPWDNTNAVAEQMQRLQDAGVQAVIQDLTNWKFDNQGLGQCETEVPVVEAECAKRGMKQFMFFRAQDVPTNGAPPSAYFTSIDMANRHAMTVWNDWAQKPTYQTFQGKPMLIIFEPNQAAYLAAYNAWLATNTVPTNYLAKFWVGNCYGGGWGWGNSESASDNSVRYVRPSYDPPGTTDWTAQRVRMTPEAWNTNVQWGLQATDFCVLSCYDERSDGSFWAIADTSGVTNAATGRPCNINPTTNWWAYYDVVRSNCASEYYFGPTYEAEGFTAKSGGLVVTNVSGFNGSGCVSMGGSNTWFEWNNISNASGYATLAFRYANGSSANRPCQINLNGTAVANLTFPPTGASNIWQTQTQKVSLNPGNNTIRVLATSSFGGPSVDQMVAVATTNAAPTLNAVTNQTLIAGQTLTITNVATDADVPAQTLTFSLVTNPPGATINPSNGVFTWRPAIAQSPSTNPISVKVADNGSPSLSATNSFSVIVNPPGKPVISSVGVNNGQFHFTITGTNGPDYTILASTNLTDWLPVGSDDGLPPPFLFTDPDANKFNQRFYRVILGP